MDPTLELFSQWVGGIGAAIGFLKVAKAKVYNPSMVFVGRVGKTMDVVEQINRELGQNGGKTIRDKVDRIDQMTSMVDARQVALMAALPEPMFWTDMAGDFTLVNRSLEELTGFSRAHMLGTEWVNFIHPQDQTRVVKEWLGPDDGAVKQKRAWLTSCRCLTPTGSVFLARIEAHPVRKSFGAHEIVGWHGVVSVEERT